VSYVDPSGYVCEGKDALVNKETSLDIEDTGESQRKLTYIVGYEGDVKDTNVRLYGTYKQLSEAGVVDGHHLLQDAAMRSITDYSRRDAPAIQADGPSTLIGSEHYNLTYYQAHATQAGTYGIEKQIGLDSATNNLNLSSADRTTLEGFVNDYFVEKLGLNNDSPTRIPGNRHYLENN
jgi:hypothetical protein